MDKNLLDDTILDVRKIEYAGFWIRVGASFIDALILSPIYFLTYYNNVSVKSIALMIILLIVAGIYKPFLEYSRQATFGKQALGIQVVNQDLEAISTKQTLLRNSPLIVMGILGLISNLYVFNHTDFSSSEDMFAIGAITQESPVYLVTQIFNFVFMIFILKVAFSKMKRGLHDDIANTYCIIKNK